MQKTYFSKKNMFITATQGPKCYGKGEIEGAWKYNGQMTTNVFHCLDNGGVSVYPLYHITPLSPT